jgi:predicted negative regulator of RcsB-dependent stress response
VEIYESEQDQVEALKKWWKENGRSVIAGLAIGLGGVVGWKSWVSYHETRAVKGSTSYEQLVELVSTNQAAAAEQHGKRLTEEFPSSTYASLGALLLAKVDLKQGKGEEAKQHLRWVMDQADFPELRQVAQLRLARLLLADAAFDEALSLVSGEATTGFEAAYQEARGDILVAKGDLEGARTAFTQALASLAATSANRQLVQMKLDNLGMAQSQGQAGKEAPAS